MRQRRARLIARRRIEIETETRAHGEFRKTRLERAEAQLRSLEIEQNADRAAIFLFKAADFRMTLGMIVVRAVAEIQSEDIDAGLEKRTDNLRVRTGRPERGDNLCITVSLHFLSADCVARRPHQ
ncbi:hypothetical protein PSAC2689_60296 [Paraburkholderia sacchari]